MSPAFEQRPGTTRTLLDGVRRTVLAGGLRVVTEHIPTVRSAAVGVFVGVGSRDETPALNGASHFLEHLLFKGTPTRTAMEISASLDGVGGEFNAYTSREYTCYHARVIDRDLPMAIDVLGDMITSSLITDEDVEAERGVILDEIAMHDDDPDSLVHNLFSASAWRTGPFSRPVAGTAESIPAISARQIRTYYRSRYRAPAVAVAVAGNVAHDDVVATVRAAFDRAGFLDDVDAVPLPPRLSERARPTRSGEAYLKRDFEQVTMMLGRRGITRTDPRRYALGVLNAAFGGGSSARLFQEVRERRGLAYSAYAFSMSYSDAGLVGVTAGSLPAKADQLLEVVHDEISKVAATGLTAEEIERGKGQLRGGMVLSLEDSASRMTRLGEAELFLERIRSLDEVLASVDAVTREDVHQVAAELFTRPETLAIVGP